MHTRWQTDLRIIVMHYTDQNRYLK